MCNLLVSHLTAVDLSTLPRKPVGIYDDAAVIVIDGTWSQSKGLYSQNPRLHDAKQVPNQWILVILYCDLILVINRSS